MSQRRKGSHLHYIRQPVEKSEQNSRKAEGSRLLFPVSRRPVKKDRINGRKQGPVAEQGDEHQQNHQQIPDKAIGYPVAHMQDQETEEEREEHVQHAKLQGHHIGNLGNQSEDEKSEGIVFSGMGVLIPFHQKKAHRHRCEIADVHHHLKPYAFRRHKGIGHMVDEHGQHGEIFDRVTADARS